MKGSYATFMQSKFFNPVFNSAIFDGSIRIYFSQPFEAQALKIYYFLQKGKSEAFKKTQQKWNENFSTVLVLIYPESESFQSAFGKNSILECEKLNEDIVIGVNSRGLDLGIELIEEICAKIEDQVENFSKQQFPILNSDANLSL